MKLKRTARSRTSLSYWLGRLRSDEGNAFTELAVTLPLLMTTLFGVVSGGLLFDRYMTVLQLGRNATSMLSRGTDFAVDKNKQLLLLATQGLDIKLSQGSGVVYLTRVQIAPPGSANEGKLVIAERHVIGDTSFASSTVGQPSSQIWPNPDKPAPNGDVKDAEDEASAVANVPASLETLPLGESMYIAEVYHGASDLVFGTAWNGLTRLAARVYY